MDGDKTEPSIDYGALRDSIGYQIRLAEVANMQTFARAFDGTAITPARLTALELIARNPGIRPARLARAMAIESSNLATLLRQLERSGLVSHAEADDRRGKSLMLTPHGTAQMATLRGSLRRHDHLLTANLTKVERETLSKLLGRMLAATRD